MKKLSIILICFFSLIIIIYIAHFYHQLYQCKFHTEQINDLTEERENIKQSLNNALYVETMKYYYETGELKLPYYKLDSIMKEYPEIVHLEYDFVLDNLNIKWYENKNN